VVNPYTHETLGSVAHASRVYIPDAIFSFIKASEETKSIQAGSYAEFTLAYGNIRRGDDEFDESGTRRDNIWYDVGEITESGLLADNSLKKSLES
jgi:hypothetical protein